MKIKHNTARGTGSITFGLGPEDDARFKEWQAAARKHDGNLFEAAKDVAAKHGDKVEVTSDPCEPEDE